MRLTWMVLGAVVSCSAPAQQGKTERQVVEEFFAREEREYSPPAPPAPPPKPPRPPGRPISHETANPECPEPEPLSDEELERRTTAVAWVREHCEPQSYTVADCEGRCRSGPTRLRCEEECSTFEAFAACPMVECPVGTDPTWKGWFYQAECPGRQAKLVEQCP